MKNLLQKTKSTLSLRPRDLHKSKSTPILLQYPKHLPPTPLSLAITTLKQTRNEMAQEIDLMPDGVKPNTFSSLDGFMAAIAK